MNKSIEQGTVALLMLGVQKDGIPVKSTILSTIMGISDSYLKKTLHKLVVAGLIDSIAGRDGGFVLQRPLKEISLGDVFRALSPDEFVFSESKIAQTVFRGCPELDKSQQRIRDAFEVSGDAFCQTLDNYPLADLLRNSAGDARVRDWEAVAHDLQATALT